MNVVPAPQLYPINELSNVIIQKYRIQSMLNEIENFKKEIEHYKKIN